MPTVKEIKGYRFFFTSNDGGEPPHIHVQHGKNVAKFWLNPVRVAKCARFAKHEIAELAKIVSRDRLEFLRAWNEHFDT